MNKGIEIMEFFTIIGQQAVRIYTLEKEKRQLQEEKKVLQQQVVELLKEKENGRLGRPSAD